MNLENRYNSDIKNESLFVFSSTINMKDVKSAASEIRKSLFSVDFRLDDKFRDAEELKQS